MVGNNYFTNRFQTVNYFTNRFQTVKYDNKKSPLMSINLGVPQGSVLGPLFFLIMINDLAFISDLMCKMFADDTTMCDSDKDLTTLINRFVVNLKPVLEWCEFNKLDLNWSKTYCMFVTNKRVKLPNEITIYSKIVDNKFIATKVKVVSSFKILGVTLDNKLNFLEHCSNIKKTVNRKLFSIKRLFYLATSVKIHFFKTFILPYFDYTLSLIIYFPQATFQSLNNCFNLCLLRLFKFKPEVNYSDDELEKEKVMSDFINKLHAYDLFTLQSRVLTKLLSFAHSIKDNSNSPTELKKQLEYDFPESNSEETLEEVAPEVYKFRNGDKIKNIIPITKFETLTFKHFFPRLLKIFRHINFKLRKDSFKDQILTNIIENLKVFLKSFPKFDLKYSVFCHGKKNVQDRKNRRH